MLIFLSENLPDFSAVRPAIRLLCQDQVDKGVDVTREKTLIAKHKEKLAILREDYKSFKEELDIYRTEHYGANYEDAVTGHEAELDTDED